MRSFALVSLLALAGCATTIYDVDSASLEAARARGDAHALLPATRADGKPVFVETGALHDHPDGREFIVNRTVVSGYVLLVAGVAQIVPGALVFGADSTCSGQEPCGLGVTVGSVLLGVGGACLVTSAILLAIGHHFRPHEWRRGHL